MATIDGTYDPNECEACLSRAAVYVLHFDQASRDAIGDQFVEVQYEMGVNVCAECRADFERAGRVFTSEFYTPKTETLEVTSEPTEQPAEDPPAADG